MDNISIDRFFRKGSGKALWTGFLADNPECDETGPADGKTKHLTAPR
jgi:hypothetical protein